MQSVRCEQRDLIDTLWNVKERLTSHVAFCALDLIDTLWNVKYKFFF